MDCPLLAKYVFTLLKITSPSIPALNNSFNIGTYWRTYRHICNRPISADNIGKPIYQSGPSIDTI